MFILYNFAIFIFIFQISSLYQYVKMVFNKLSKDAVKILLRKLNWGGSQPYPLLPSTPHTHPQYILIGTRFADTHQMFTHIHHSMSKPQNKFTNTHHKFNNTHHKFTNTHLINTHPNTQVIHHQHTNTSNYHTNTHHQPTINTLTHHTVTTPLICVSRQLNHSSQSNYQPWSVIDSLRQLHTTYYSGIFLSLCNIVRIDVAKKFYRIVERSHRSLSFHLRWWRRLALVRTPWQCPRLGRNVLFGSVFLSPSTLLKKLQHEDDPKVPLFPQLPKEPVPEKRRSLLARLLLEMYELCRMWLRVLRLALTFCPILFLYPITYLGPSVAQAWWGILLAGNGNNNDKDNNYNLVIIIVKIV